MNAGVQAFIGLGANLADPARQIRQALQALAKLERSRLVARSALYRSDPLGPPGQPDYINAVAQLETQLSPHQLLHALQRIEAQQGRRRDGERWGPRTLDLDLLLYGLLQIESADLVVPHPQLSARAFVLYPLAELLPAEALIPGRGSLGELLEQLPPEGITRLDMA